MSEQYCCCEPGLDGLAHIALFTADIEQTIDFYTNKLGFDCVERLESQKPEGITHIAFLVLEDIILEATQPAEGFDPSSAGKGCFPHLAIQVTGMEDVIADLKDRGIVFDTEDYIPLPNMFGGSKCIFFKGPSGESLELFEYGEIDCCDCDCDCDCDSDGGCCCAGE